MKVTCPHCNAIIQAEDINLGDKIAKCRLCDSVFNCSAQLSTLGGNTPEPNRDFSRQKSEVLLPEKIQISHEDDGLKLSLRWFSPKYLFLTFFCIIWDGAIIFFISMMLSQAEYFFLLFLSIHIAVGVGLTYYTIAGYFNYTVVTVNHQELQVKIGPLPWPGNKRIESRQVDQLYCKEKITHGRHGNTSITYYVHLKTKEGLDLKLVPGLSENTQAFYLEQEIERFLQIRDVSVGGEMQR